MVLDEITKAEEIAKPTPVTPDEETLKAVMADPKNSALFGDFLKAQGGEQYAEGFAHGDIDEAQMAGLEDIRKKFFERKGLAREVIKGLTPEVMDGVIRHSPTMLELSKKLPAADIRAMVEKHLEGIALKDETNFGEVKKKLETYTAHKSGAAYKGVDEAVSKLLTTAKIDVQTFVKINAELDDTKRQAGLRAEIKKNFTWFQTFSDIFNRGGVSTKLAQELAGKKGPIETARKEMGKNLEHLGGALNTALTGNDEARKILLAEILGDKSHKAERSKGFREMKGKTPSEREILDEWSRNRPANFDAMTPDDQMKAKNKMLKSVNDRTREGMENADGFWAGLFRILLGQYTNENSRRGKALRDKMV